MFNLKNKTILQILPALNQGGVERGTLDIAEGILKAGGKACVVSAGGKLETKLQEIGGHHITLPLTSKNPFTILWNIRRIQRIIKDNNVDLIHARSRAPAWSAYFVSKILKIPFVTTFHGTYNFQGRWKKYYNSVMARGDRVIAISNFIREHIEKNYKDFVNFTKIKVIFRGVDLTYFDPEAVTHERCKKLRETWELTSEGPVILMVGRLARWKGQSVLLESLKRLSDFKGNCLILGSSQGHENYLKELQTFVRDSDLTYKVKFIENCHDMPAAYSLASVVVHASIAPEAFGRVIAEAQAMGKFVIASSLGAPKEIIDNQNTGILVAPADVAELVDALEMALSLSSVKQLKIAQSARKRVQNLFSKQVMIEETLKIYTDLLQKINFKRYI